MEQVTSDSTCTPSRRAFLGSAVGAGVCTAQPPLFTVPAIADAALIAMGPGLAALKAARHTAYNLYSDTEDLISDLIGPPPKKLDEWFSATWSCGRDYFDARDRYQAERDRDAAKRAEMERHVGFAAMEQAFDCADDALVEELERVAATRATTLEGLVFKVRLIGLTGTFSDEIRDSIIADLLAMA